jgi:hypothetical protein
VYVRSSSYTRCRTAISSVMGGGVDDPSEYFQEDFVRIATRSRSEGDPLGTACNLGSTSVVDSSTNSTSMGEVLRNVGR